MNTTENIPTLSVEYWCDQCGKRYPGPGVCTNEHPPNELKPLEVSAEAEGTTAEEIAPDQGSGNTAADPTPAKPVDMSAGAPAAAPETPQPAAEPAPAEAAPDKTVAQSALAAFDAAYQGLKTALGL